jgi:hypothetical protein
MYDVFISHASEDKKDFVYPLVEKLQNAGPGFSDHVTKNIFATLFNDHVRSKVFTDFEEGS